MRSTVVALVIAALVAMVALAPYPADARDRNPVGMDEFMTGLACIESGGRFDAVNDRSGALGKYQIMPRNWPAWANRYMGNRWAKSTPRNQEFVARERLSALYEKHGSWRVVAYWWLTGNGDADESLWSPKSAKYVDKVMGVAIRAATPRLAATVPERCFPGPFSAPRIRTEPLPRVWVVGGRVTVRTAPGYENRSVAYVRRGFRLAVLSKGTDARGKSWLKVGLSDGQTGWVAEWFTMPAAR